MRKLIYLIVFFVLSCEKETECIKISNKYGGNGLYYFEWDRTNPGQSERRIGTGAVSEEVFEQYEVGDVYCIDELML